MIATNDQASVTGDELPQPVPIEQNTTEQTDLNLVLEDQPIVDGVESTSEETTDIGNASEETKLTVIENGSLAEPTPTTQLTTCDGAPPLMVEMEPGTGVERQ